MGGTYSTPNVPSVLYTDEFVTSLPDQSGRVVVITGTSHGGLGFVIAQCLLRKGARVICLNRDVDKSRDLTGDVLHVKADLMDFSSIKKAAAEVRLRVAAVDVLLLNGGVMMLESKNSIDGFDVQMQTNHLSHFLLTREIFPILSPNARIVVQSSEARNGPPFSDLQERFFSKDPTPGALGNNLYLGHMQRYQQSKLANAVFVYELRSRLLARGSAVQALLVHPGICASNLAKTSTDGAHFLFSALTRVIMSLAQSTEDGALPMILAAVQDNPPVFQGPTEGIKWLGLNYIRGHPRELQPEPFCCSESNKELLWSKSCDAVNCTDWLGDEEVVTVLDSRCRAIDLGHPLDSSSIFWPGGEGFKLCITTSGGNQTEDFYAAGNFSCSEHGGTHIDAPWHFNETGATVDQLSLRELVAKVRVVSTFGNLDAERTAESLNGTVEAIIAHEAAHGTIPAGCIVLFHTGWGRRYAEGAHAYLGWAGPSSAFEPAKTDLFFPGIVPAAARLLVTRRVAGVGLDTASLDPGSCKTFDAHRILLGNGIFGIENLSPELSRLPARGATLAALPLKLTGGSGAPARVVAFVPM